LRRRRHPQRRCGPPAGVNVLRPGPRSAIVARRLRSDHARYAQRGLRSLCRPSRTCCLAFSACSRLWLSISYFRLFAFVFVFTFFFLFSPFLFFYFLFFFF